VSKKTVEIVFGITL